MRIHEYASVGDCDGLRCELAMGVFVDARDEHDYTPLTYAVEGSQANEEVILLLIAAGADANASVHHWKYSPIVLAARAGNLRVVQLLLNAGANIKATSRRGYTILIDVMYALNDEKLVPMVEFLIRGGAEINCESDYGESPLSVASRMGRFDAVKFLLDSGADPSRLQWTDLLKAVALGTCDDVKRLLNESVSITDRDRWDRTPWLVAAVGGDVEKAKLLHSGGADVNDRARAGETALMRCASRGHAEMLRWLIEIGADVEAADDEGNSALMLAARAGNATSVQLLLDAGADPSRKNEYRDSAMSMASSEQVVRMLIRAGEDIGDIRTEMKRTLAGLRGGDKLNISAAQYESGKRQRFGTSNPEVMSAAFWAEMVRSGISAYHARAQFDDTESMEEPVWCFSRFGTSFT